MSTQAKSQTIHTYVQTKRNMYTFPGVQINKGRLQTPRPTPFLGIHLPRASLLTMLQCFISLVLIQESSICINGLLFETSQSPYGNSINGLLIFVFVIVSRNRRGVLESLLTLSQVFVWKWKMVLGFHHDFLSMLLGKWATMREKAGKPATRASKVALRRLRRTRLWPFNRFGSSTKEALTTPSISAKKNHEKSPPALLECAFRPP